jgi:hypothetical protein
MKWLIDLRIALLVSLSLFPLNLFAATHYVWTNSPASIAPYTNWSTAARDIQSAIDISSAGETVLVIDGTYNTGGRAVCGSLTNRIVIDRPITVESVNGAGVTMIEGAGQLGDGAIRCAYVGTNAILKGFTLTDGHTRTNGEVFTQQSGGGAWCEDLGVIRNCVISSNSATQYGGGTYGGALFNCALIGNSADSGGGAFDGTICNCTISSNSVASDGGGVHSCTLNNCTLSENSAYNGGAARSSILNNCSVSNNRGWEGGGVYGSTLNNCTLFNNSARYDGGGALGGTLNNCLILNNGAGIEGGGAYWLTTMNNCTLSGNCATYGGVAEECTLNNCIDWQNSATFGINYSYNTMNYCCTSNPEAGTGNIISDPQLTPAYRLKATSPCIDAGRVSNAPPTDVDGEARWDDPRHSNVVSIVDIGADEFVDTDLDGMADCWEINYFGSITNRGGTSDVDHDDLNDLAEYNNGTNPTNSDTDADGMPDGWEVHYLLNPLIDDGGLDRDADGLSNLGEYIADTDPTNTDSALSILSIRPQYGGIRIDWKGGPQAWQFLECREELRGTNEPWLPLLGLPPPTPLTNAVINMGATNRLLFYRIRAQR